VTPISKTSLRLEVEENFVSAAARSVSVVALCRISPPAAICVP
jgi:hypothetical protein